MVERVLLELEKIGRDVDPLRERLCVDSVGGVVRVLQHAGPLRARLDLMPQEARELAGVLLVAAGDGDLTVAEARAFASQLRETADKLVALEPRDPIEGLAVKLNCGCSLVGTKYVRTSAGSCDVGHVISAIDELDAGEAREFAGELLAAADELEPEETCSDVGLWRVQLHELWARAPSIPGSKYYPDWSGATKDLLMGDLGLDWDPALDNYRFREPFGGSR